MRVCPQLVLTAPEAPSPKVLRLTYQDVSPPPPPALDLGIKATSDSGQPRRSEARHSEREPCVSVVLSVAVFTPLYARTATLLVGRHCRPQPEA